MTREKKETHDRLRLGGKILFMALGALLVLLMLQGPVWGEFLVDEARGTVTDSTTGLMWQRTTGNHGEGLTWDGAVSYCENLTLAGYDDWRMPDSTELQSIIDHLSYNPSVNARFFPDTEPSGYWSSTLYRPNPDYAWRVNFYYVGYMNISKKTNSYFVRAVRTAP